MFHVKRSVVAHKLGCFNCLNLIFEIVGWSVGLYSLHSVVHCEQCLYGTLCLKLLWNLLVLFEC
jgi:hypothetical protein